MFIQPTEPYSPKLIAMGLVISAAVFWLLTLQSVEAPIVWCLSITLLTAFYWVSGALPIPAASLIPFVLFPISGILTFREAGASLGNHIIILLMGGFMIAKGLEKANLHQRFAIMLLRSIGAKGGIRLIFAFMICGASLSMWISNTASCLILLPIAMAVLKQTDDDDLYLPVLLAVAFSCNLGGIGTLVGTPTNLVFAGVYQTVANQEFGFMRWLKIGFPVLLIGIPLITLWLGRSISKSKPIALPKLGAWSSAEKRVLAVFLLIVFLWIFRLEPFGGWSTWTGIKTAGDSTVALLGVLLMFLIPSGSEKKNSGLLDWATASDIPWGMLILFAGGITIAAAFKSSGTAQLIGDMLAGLANLPPFAILLVVCLSVTFLTEITSNVATTTLLMPILAAAATSAQMPVEFLMVPAAMSASCAFMLPVATTPNAIVFGSGHVTVKQMAHEGIVINLMMAVVISGVCYFML